MIDDADIAVAARRDGTWRNIASGTTTHYRDREQKSLANEAAHLAGHVGRLRQLTKPERQLALGAILCAVQSRRTFLCMP